MKCRTCGENIKVKSKYCANCGSEIDWEEPKTRFSRPPEKTNAPRQLQRSRSNRIIAGVCGGIGEYYNIDPTIIRLLFLLFTLGGGAGVLAYLIFVIVIPESPLDPWVE